MDRNKTDSVRQLQKTLYRKAKQGKEVKFYSLYDKLYREDVLWEAWRQVKANKGAAGVDGESIEAVVNSGQEWLMIDWLEQKLRAKKYRFDPVRRANITKPKCGTRPLDIATVEDRVVLTAMKLILEPSLKPTSMIALTAIVHKETPKWRQRRFMMICIGMPGERRRLISAAILPPYPTTNCCR